ncbi:calcium/proton exchanger, partial [Tanacetum coccineum]
MAKGQPKKKKKAKKDLFTIYFHYDGIFICSPLEYTQGHMKELNDTNFHDMSYDHLKEIALRLVPHGCFEKLYYCQTGVKLNLGLTELRSNQDIGDMLKVGYENGNAIDMYVEHFGYDIMEMAQADRNEEQNQNSIESSDDDYNSSDCEEIENVDFQTEGDESVVIKDISTSDPFLNKLCSARIMFRGTTEHIQAEIPLVDPDENQIDAVNKVKSGVHYPAFDPDIPWDKMQPTLGMRYETPQQLKLALANYGVANGYQLWYMKNDWREVLVYCGRNVEEGRCAGKKGNKDRVMPNKVRSGVKKKVVKKQIVKKKVVKKQTVKKTTVLDSGEGTSQSTKWTKKQIQDSKKVVCPFRLYASWMSNEHSFQIKSLISEHKCCRNYNLGALVTYRWIALQYFKEIIEDPFMRAKQLALFDHEGGLIEHYGKLYQYRKALLDSNPGSTCRLDVDESANGSATFRRIYICFLGVKDAMGRDANNQMYPIAWTVVMVENADNWGWFLHLLHDDLSLNDRNEITIISDSHKGLIDVVNDLLPEAEHVKYKGLSFQVVSKSWKLRKTIKVTVLVCNTRGRGRGRSRIGNKASGSGMGGIGEASVRGSGGSAGRGTRGGGMASSGGRRGGGRGSRCVSSTRGGGMAGSSSMGILTYEKLDEMTFRECIEEQAREQARIDAEQERFDKEMRKEREWEEKQDYFNPANFREDSIEEALFNQAYAEVFIPSIHSQPTQQSSVWVKDTTDVTTENINEAPASETSDVSAMVEDLFTTAV